MKVNNLDSMIYLNYWILQTLLAYIGKELIQINHPNNDLAKPCLWRLRVTVSIALLLFQPTPLFVCFFCAFLLFPCHLAIYFASFFFCIIA